MKAMGVIVDGAFYSDFTDVPIRIANPPAPWNGFWGLVGDTTNPTLIPLLAVPGTLPISDAFFVNWKGMGYTGVPPHEYPFLVLVTFALQVVHIDSPPMLSLRTWAQAAWTALHYRDREIRLSSGGLWVGEEWVAFYPPPETLPMADFPSARVRLAGYDPLKGMWVFADDLSPTPSAGWGFVAPEGGICFAPNGRVRIHSLWRQ